MPHSPGMLLLLLPALTVTAEPPAALHLSVCPPQLAAAQLLPPEPRRHHSTVHAAQAAARAALADGHSGDVVIELCQGAHPVSEALVIEQRDVVAPNRTLTFRGPRGGLATLDAGVPVTGWASSSTIDGVWEASLPAGSASRQLWVGGRRAPRAHSNPAKCSGGPVPDGGFRPTECDKTLTGGNLTSTGYSGLPDPQPHISSKSLTKWLPGAELVYGRGATGASWTEPRCTVASVTAGTQAGTVDVVMAQPCWSHAFHKSQSQGPHKGPSDVENSLEFLSTDLLTKSTAGEWFGDFATNKIYYQPLPGETPSGIKAILGSVPASDSGGSATIVLQLGVERVQFTNLEFQHNTWLEPSGPGGFVDLQSGFFFGTPDGEDTALRGVPGVLAMHGSKNINVTNCTFKNLGLTGVLADGGSQGIDVTHSHFADLSGSAISLGNVSKPIMTEEEQDGPFVVENNDITDTGAEYKGCAGVFGGYIAEASILHNDIANCSNGCVTIGWGWGANNSMHDNKVNSNKITRSNTYLFDCGSIYTLSAQPNSEVAHNYIVNQVLLFGSLYHDAKSAFFHTHHNVVVGGPMWLYLQWGTMGPVHDILVENNWHNQTVDGGCAMVEHKATCPENLTIQNNVLVKGSDWPAEALAVKVAAGVQAPTKLF